MRIRKLGELRETLLQRQSAAKPPWGKVQRLERKFVGSSDPKLRATWRNRMTEFDLFHSLFEYHPDTGSLRWKTKKGRANIGDEVGWITIKGYREAKVNQVQYKVHRIIFMMMTGHWPDGEIDHKNGNKTDNSWINLRLCTHLENMHNQKMHSDNTSGITGVSWHKRIKKWQASIRHDNRTIHVGYFNSIEEARRARNEKEQTLWNGFKTVDDIVSSARRRVAACKKRLKINDLE